MGSDSLTPGHRFGDALTPDAVVLGGGVAGLTVAWDLTRAGLRVVLIERHRQVGGLLAPVDLAGMVVDAGAESAATRNPAVAQMLAEVAPELALASPHPVGARLVATRRRWGRHRVTRPRIPAATHLGIPVDPWAADARAVIGWRGALRAGIDRVLPVRVGVAAPNLAGLVRARMGRAVANRLVDAICRSVYSTPADRLDPAVVAPGLVEAMVRSGSLAAAVRTLTSGRPAGSAVCGITGGMWQLPTALAAAIERAGGHIWCSASAQVGVDTDTGVCVGAASTATYRVTVSRETEAGATGICTLRTPRLVLATPGPQALAYLADLGQSVAGMSPADFGAVTVVLLWVRGAALDTHPVGTGCIAVAPAAGQPKALTHSTAKWPWLAALLPKGEHLLRMSYDGAVAASELAPARLLADVAHLTGVSVAGLELQEYRVVTWADAVVPATAAHRAATARWRQPAAEVGSLDIGGGSPGLAVVGSWVSGTGLATVIPHARATAGRLTQFRSGT